MQTMLEDGNVNRTIFGVFIRSISVLSYRMKRADLTVKFADDPAKTFTAPAEPRIL